MPSQIDLISDKFRQELVARNVYNEKQNYDSSHPNANSDGDEKGKNEIGNSTDVKKRTELLAKNIYKSNNKYGSEHPNALSNDDEKGRGDVNGKIGTLTDIQKRNENIVKNTYKSDNSYSTEHPNARGNGDDKGKGTGKFLDVYNYSAGSKTDVNERTSNTKVNVKYNSNKTYPDFPTK